jgi:hypothetical protein
MLDHVARVIHELDEQGCVVRIGWEPAAAIDERRKAANATIHLMAAADAVLGIFHDRARDNAAAAELWESKETTQLREAMMDLRPLIPALQRSHQVGMKLPMWESSPESKRYYRRSA